MVSQTAIHHFEFFCFPSEISLLVPIHIWNGPHRFGRVFNDTFQIQPYHLCQSVEWNFGYLEHGSLFVHISFDFSFFCNCGPSGEEVLKVSLKLSTSRRSDSSESVVNCSESLDAITAFIISSAE